MVDRLATASGRTFDHEVLYEMMPTGRDLRQSLLKLLRLQPSQETQPAQIYPEHRHLMKTHLMSGLQNRAIATEDNRQFGIKPS